MCTIPLESTPPIHTFYNCTPKSAYLLWVHTSYQPTPLVSTHLPYTPFIIVHPKVTHLLSWICSLLGTRESQMSSCFLFLLKNKRWEFIHARKMCYWEHELKKFGQRPELRNRNMILTYRPFHKWRLLYGNEARMLFSQWILVSNYQTDMISFLAFFLLSIRVSF